MCNHDRLRTVGDRVFCCNCNAELSLDFLMSQGKKQPEEVKPEEVKPEKPRKRTGKKSAKEETE